MLIFAAVDDIGLGTHGCLALVVVITVVEGRILLLLVVVGNLVHLVEEQMLFMLEVGCGGLTTHNSSQEVLPMLVVSLNDMISNIPGLCLGGPGKDMLRER